MSVSKDTALQLIAWGSERLFCHVLFFFLWNHLPIYVMYTDWNIRLVMRVYKTLMTDSSTWPVSAHAITQICMHTSVKGMCAFFCSKIAAAHCFQNLLKFVCLLCWERHRTYTCKENRVCLCVVCVFKDSSCLLFLKSYQCWFVTSLSKTPHVCSQVQSLPQFPAESAPGPRQEDQSCSRSVFVFISAYWCMNAWVYINNTRSSTCSNLRMWASTSSKQRREPAFAQTKNR